MSIKRRVDKLEAKNGIEQCVFVFPSAPIPPHDYDSDKEYFGAKLTERIGPHSLQLCIFNASKERKEDGFVLIKDMEALSRYMSKYTSRVGALPNPLQPKPGEFDSFSEEL